MLDTQAIKSRVDDAAVETLRADVVALTEEVERLRETLKAAAPAMVDSVPCWCVNYGRQGFHDPSCVKAAKALGLTPSGPSVEPS